MEKESIGNELMQELPQLPISNGAGRSGIIRENLQRARKTGDRLQLLMGELLWEVKKNEYWKDWEYTENNTPYKYLSFDQFIDKELDERPRRAAYLIEIYDKFIVELGLPREIIKDIQWSKAIHLTKIVDANNWKQVLDETKNMTQTEIIRYKRHKLLVAGLSENPTAAELEALEERINIQFPLTKEQHTLVKDALNLAEKVTGSVSVSHNLSLMASDFIATYSSDTSPEALLAGLRRLVEVAKRVYGADIEIKAVDPLINPNWVNLKQEDE
jgi:hypothetical protein